MDISAFTEVISILLGGGVGAFAMQIYTARLNKKKLAAETEAAAADAQRKKQDNYQDAFDTVYQQLNKCMGDYTAISEEYRVHRENSRKFEQELQQRIQDNCMQLATMKSKVTYLKGLRCYDSLCKKRINVNPDKKQMKMEESCFGNAKDNAEGIAEIINQEDA